MMTIDGQQSCVILGQINYFDAFIFTYRREHLLPHRRDGPMVIEGRKEEDGDESSVP